MGGKSKQARVKNNAKPSNSSRSAELLGSSVPTFVGFSAHSEHGLIPFAPGFSDNMALDTVEPNIDPQLQLILRKMSKKDPVTKVKALQELSEMLNSSDVETVKSILPLWPKFYQNLSNDVDHRVRESAQEVMSIIVLKCKKAVAPFLKQLVPSWLASTFDNYAPAASTASTSFAETFANNSNKVRDVCLHCQQEIVEYTVRNLTFHTASTLSMSKNCTAEEAEQKYQRVVYSSLKTLSFFMDKTNGSELNNVRQNIQDMLANSKFWSFAKNKVVKVKASWFELLYNLLQNTSIGELMFGCKAQLIQTCFQHLDESDPLIAPHVWGCILQVQTTYEDWHDVISVQKNVLPKLSNVLRSGCNKNAAAICPNLLPFLSKLSQESLKEMNLNKFYKEFFDDIKIALTTITNISKSDCSALAVAYFECLRYVFQKMISCIQTESSVDKVDSKTFAHKLLNENIIFLIKWCLINEGPSVKYIILHSSSLIAYWADPDKKSDVYLELLDEFWKNMIAYITDSLENKKDEQFLDHVIELVDKLHSVNSKYEDQRVKFVFGSEETQDTDNQTSNSAKSNSNQKSSTTVTYVEIELKKLVIQLIRLCLSNLTIETSSNYITKVRKLTSMFCDLDFYSQISEEKTIIGTLSLFLENMHNLEGVAVDDGLDIIFEILNLMPKEDKFNVIKSKLLQMPQPCIQYAIMNRLLSYPLNVEPQVRNILSQPEASEIITNLAKGILEDNSKDCFNLLRKCFFQSDSGEIPINSTTVDNILKIASQPLTANSKMEHLMDVCGSFISQVMSVVCSGGNSSPDVQRDIFHILFEFTIEHVPDDNISEDTLWEIATCWQDALSCQDIKSDSEMLHKCKETLNNFVQRDNLTFEAIESTAETINQFIMCSTEHISDETERLVHIDRAIKEFFTPQALNRLKLIQELCLFHEALQNKVSVGVQLDKDCLQNINMIETFRQILLNSCILYKMVCKHTKPRKNSLNDDSEEHENTDDYCDVNENVLKQWTDTLYNETITCINIASVGEALITNASQIDDNLQTLAVELSEKVKMLLREGSEDFISNLKERMFDIAAQDNDITSCRALLYLVCINQYAQFEENAHILLIEELSEFFVSRNSLKAYVNTLQYFLPNLTSKAITMHMPIMRTNPKILWIRASIFRCLVQNNFISDYNERSDQNIIAHTIRFLSEVSDEQHVNKGLLMYNVDISQQTILSVVDTIEFISILHEVIEKFPYELTIKNWDAVRIGISSWILSVSKSIHNIKNPQVALFITKVFQLYAALTKFIQNDKQKSSTEMLKNMIDEWENLFSREVNLVLFKSYYRLVELQEATHSISSCFNSVLEVITPAIELFDYEVIYNFYKSSTKVTLDNVLNFLLKNVSNDNHYIRTHCVYILKQITTYFVRCDIETYESKSENVNTNDSVGDWHFLSKLEDYIGRYELPIRKYLDDFNFKLTDIADMKPIDRNECLCYLFLWDCIIYVCSNSPITLRSVYTNWLHEKRYEENFIYFLFRAMPPEILKNHDSKIMLTDVFKGLTWGDIKDKNLVVEKYACHLYTEVLRRLPAVVRKWWNTCQSRQKTFVDKLTTNFVSPIICNEELKAIGNKKEKHENMQVTVHTSTREVLAVYSIDEARMELVITLAPNYPLGSVKVDIGKQIGGRLASRNIGMQLTIFLTHQNGSIFDGLTLWKNNLDKKFEGVEECYVCYTVIHQETCQLPKLSCKTCRKKFHGPCLYKWFTTSSKSTCPICRNVF